jgi:hypothetical protein
MATLQRLVLDFRNDEEIVVRCLYRSSLDGPRPNTKGRRREVTDLTREGLRQALVSLEGDAALVGCSGFTQKEDVLLVEAKQEGDAA